MCNGYYIITELNDVLKSGCYSSNLDYDNVDWFVNKDIRLENEVAFYLKKHKQYLFNDWRR